jgi:hypothetical protein
MGNDKIAFFDCFSGASGDMLLGALLDAGLDLEDLRTDLARLPLSGYRLAAERGVSRGLAGTRFTVIDPGSDRPARTLSVIQDMIRASSLPEETGNRCLAIFVRLAEAEAQVHGTTIEQVHFHELGAVDTLVDVVGFVSGLERLGIDRVYASPLTLGNGTIQTEHGRLPVPAPATLKLLAGVNAPVVPSTAGTELVTPTGAVLLAHLATFARPAMQIEQVGYGLGSKELPWANAVRVWLGPPLAAGGGAEGDVIALLECNLDDTTGEALGYTMERLLEAGALDVWFTPIQMKKSRPGVMLSVQCRPQDSTAAQRIILQETTTLGVRVQQVRRATAGRRLDEVSTPWGVVRTKVKLLDGKPVAVSPEYEDCARLALEARVPLRQVLETANRLASIE